ncbi:MAG: hypothetical protein IPP83_14845 [Flavobacteriales bacterium]|nr:hypothetical protein [Flavobacteriales bacterium]
MLDRTKYSALIRSVSAAMVAVLCAAFAMIDEPLAIAKREFGFSLNPNTQGELYTLFIYTVYQGEVVDSRPMRPGPYILQVSGIEESPANIESIDLFEEYGINGCGPWGENGAVHVGLDCRSINSLWKLRYRDALMPGQGLGWSAEEFTPSPRQQILLQAYRSPIHTHWHGPYFGKDAFRLLRDMQDPEWVRMYRGAD